jgi:alkylated DNA repair protein (DNA oxidative demethylase)
VAAPRRVQQLTLLEPAKTPAGFRYQPDFITDSEQRDLVAAIQQLQFKHVEMRGVVARRRIAHLGWTYGYYSRRSEPGPSIPSFLLPLRARAAHWAGISADGFAEALVTEYPDGAAIGWHRDAPVFGDVIAGISLLAASRMKFRPYVSPADQRGLPPRRATCQVPLEPRSAYVISGAARRDFEHSIPAVDALRYSITFRTLKSS